MEEQKHDTVGVHHGSELKDQTTSFDKDIETASSDEKTHRSIHEEDADVLYQGRGTAAERRLLFKQDLRIVPLSAFIYLLCSLDRSNIGNAKVLNEDTGNDVSFEIQQVLGSR